MTDNVIPTSERLARAMEQEGCPAALVAKARAKWFDDYEAPDAAPDLPQSALVTELLKIGKKRLAARVIVGEFDATKAESDAWWEREGKTLAAGMGLPARLDLLPFVGPETSVGLEQMARELAEKQQRDRRRNVGL